MHVASVCMHDRVYPELLSTQCLCVYLSLQNHIRQFWRTWFTSNANIRCRKQWCLCSVVKTLWRWSECRNQMKQFKLVNSQIWQMWCIVNENLPFVVCYCGKKLIVHLGQLRMKKQARHSSCPFFYSVWQCLRHFGCHSLWHSWSWRSVRVVPADRLTDIDGSTCSLTCLSEGI